MIMKNQSVRTICCNPSVYENFTKPNTLEFNNSLNTKDCLLKGEFPQYKRDCISPCNMALLSIMSKLYHVPIENCLLANSGVALATMLSLSNRFNRILVFKSTYCEMVSAYNSNNKVITFDENFTDFQNNDLVCFESIAVPECIQYDYAKIVKRAKNAKAFVCIDNTIKTWYRTTLKQYDPDFIIESMSKFGNGLNSSLIGFIYSKDTNFLGNLCYLKQVLGFYAHEFDIYLTLCNIQTMPLRLDQIKKTSIKVEDLLNTFDLRYASYSDSGIFLFDIPENMTNTDVANLFSSFNVIKSADTFGAPFTAASFWQSLHKIRISVGLEEFNDLVDDIVKLSKALST